MKHLPLTSSLRSFSLCALLATGMGLSFLVGPVPLADAQEGMVAANCNNGIDDDGDQYIDRFDTECGLVPEAAATCTSPVDPPAIDVRRTANSNVVGADSGSGRIQPVAADLDGDDQVEIIAPKTGQAITILNGSTLVEEDAIAGAQIPRQSQGLAVGELDPSNTHLEIVWTTDSGTNDSFLRVARHNGTSWDMYTGSVDLADTGDVRNTGGLRDGGAVSLADFDQDGTPEILVGASIFRFTTGATPSVDLLVDAAADTPAGAARGRQERGFSVTVAIDMLASVPGLELVAGYQVYSIDTTVPTWTASVVRELPAVALTGRADGITAVADMDLDGDLDVIVADDHGTDRIYAWDPNPVVPVLLAAWATGAQLGYPTIADVYDDDFADDGVRNDSVTNIPEVVAIVRETGGGTAAKMRAYNLSDAANHIWSLDVDDDSSRDTRVASHDLNNDGIAEVLYRSEAVLRIVYGGPMGPGFTPASVSANRDFASVACSSVTRWEGPIVVDVDDDDETEIVVACGNRISLFESDITTWTGGPPIWHQYAYNQSIVGEDGRIPAFQQNITLEIPPGSGIRPLNVWMAQHFGFRGVKPGLAARADATSPVLSTIHRAFIDAEVCSGATQTTDVTLAISNVGGDFPLPSGTPVAFYEGDPAAGGSLIATSPTSVTVPSGESTSMRFALDVTGRTLPLTLHWLVNDDGTDPANAPVVVEAECDTTNNANGPAVVCGPDADGDGIDDGLDADEDNDGIPDTVEGGLGDPSADDDSDGVPNYRDTDFAGFVDANNDGVDDRVDADSDGVPNHRDLDADNDGVPDLVENGGATLDLDRDGVVDVYTDADRDGLATVFDQDDSDPSATGSKDSLVNSDARGPADYLDLDADDDGIVDLVEASGTDVDGDGRVDGFADANGNGFASATDPSEAGAALPTPNTDGASSFDFQDPDADGDGNADSVEGHDANGDGTPDRRASGIDSDGDGLDDAFDPDASGIPAAFVDRDGDGMADFMDTDDDGDGLNSALEDADTDADGTPDYLDDDDDGDGLLTRFEAADGNTDGDPADARDTDADGTPDFLDRDDDGDGLLTRLEMADLDMNGDPADAENSDGDASPDYLDNDDDNDGIFTQFEAADPNMDGDPSDARNTDDDAGGLADYLDPDDDGDGVATAMEDADGNADGSPQDAADTDSDRTPDYLDDDDDGDRIATATEIADGAALVPPNSDVDGDSTPNRRDGDSDGDGVRDITEGRDDLDSDGIPNYLDPDSAPLDTDEDSVRDDVECPGGADCPDTDGDGTPDVQDADDDGDGVPTALEFPRGDTDEDGTEDYLDADDDGDGIETSVEDVDEDGDPTNDDTDEDGLADYLDPDDDNDGIATAEEVKDSREPTDTAPGDDVDGDGAPNWRDTDADGDGLGDQAECSTGSDCPDLNQDGVPGYLDPNERPDDSDGDGIPDSVECPDTDNCTDTDGDGDPDFRDADDDGDGLPTASERPDMNDRDSDGDGRPDHLDDDDDDDGVPTATEIEPGNAEAPTDTDGDETPDYLDTDDDDDGIPTANEIRDAMALSTPSDDVDGDGLVNWRDTDSDGDGVPDGEENRDLDRNGVQDFLEVLTGGPAGGSFCTYAPSPSPLPWGLLGLAAGAWAWRRRAGRRRQPNG